MATGRAAAVVALAWAASAVAQPAAPPPGATSCSGCHNAKVSTALGVLQGQSPDEIAAAMRAFRSGERPATLMNRIAKGFTDEEIRAIAAWVAEPHQ